MATTAKITEILNFKEWEGPHGKLYYIYMKLDNGETINLGKKKSDAFKVGDTVCYESAGDNKWKEVKEEYKPKATYNPEANNRGAMIGMAIKQAFDKVYQGEDDFQKAAYLAQRIFELAMDMYNSVETKPETETAENDELPF